MRIYRLLEMTTLLLRQKTIPAREFAGRFGVSVRTVYRDVEELSAAGIPVYMSKGKGGGISLLEPFTLDKTLVSEGEIDSLLLALKTLQVTRVPEVDRVLAKLEGFFKNSPAGDWVEIDFSAWGSKPDEDKKFNRIKAAILGRNQIAFDYIDAGGEKSRRRVEPMQVIFKSHAWYLWGYCHERADFRTFRLSRMKDLAVLEDRFERREGKAQQPGERQERPKVTVTVKLKFSPAVTYRVYDDFDDNLILKTGDGACLVTVDLVEDEWLYGFLLSYGCFVEVLEPAHLRGILVERMKKAIRMYD